MGKRTGLSFSRGGDAYIGNRLVAVIKKQIDPQEEFHYWEVFWDGDPSGWTFRRMSDAKAAIREAAIEHGLLMPGTR